jgi:hypothetical protein
MPRKRLRVAPRRPGYDDKREMVAVLVPSPLTEGTYDAAVINIRESPLAAMLHRGQIDEAQYEAGKWFRKTYEATRMGSMAIDPSREPVDTSGVADPIPDTLIAATRLLRAARYELGWKGYWICELVCGQGFTVKEQAHVGRTEKGTGWLLRHALDRLAEWRGFASPRDK